MSPRARALVLALAPALAACGAAPRPEPNAWHDRTDLRPAPGRVPLVVESAGGAQHVAVARTTGLAERGAPRWLCDTPCTLYLAPGRAGIFTGGRGVRDSFVAVDVPARGGRARVRAPDATAYGYARAGFTSGFFLGLVGTLFLVIGPVEAFASSPTAAATFVIGGALLGAGVAFVVPSWIAMGRLRTGVERVTPWSPPTRVAWAISPTPGGALATVALRF